MRDTFALGTNDVVYHVNYFSQLSVIGAISQWLPLGTRRRPTPRRTCPSG